MPSWCTRFRYEQARASKALTPGSPLPSWIPGPRGRIGDKEHRRALPRALASWAILPTGACGWFPAPEKAGEPSVGYSVPKVHWSVALGRHFTPETVRGGYHPCRDWMTQVSFPFGPAFQPIAQVGSYDASTMPLLIVYRSHVLGVSPHHGLEFIAFLPLHSDV